MRVLLVEDDNAIATSLRDALTTAGHQVTHVESGTAALTAAVPDLVLLDLGLPDLDGFDVCQRLRSKSDVPIIVITARGEEVDRVLGLELGADDYLVKPFGFRELHARMRAVARRTGSPGSVDHDDGPLRVGSLTIDERTHRVFLDDEEIALTPKEFELLSYLAADPGAAMTRTDIIEGVWDANWFGPTKTLDAHVAGIRRKLGDRRWIEAVRGVGFRLNDPSEMDPE